MQPVLRTSNQASWTYQYSAIVVNCLAGKKKKKINQLVLFFFFLLSHCAYIVLFNNKAGVKNQLILIRLAREQNMTK